MNLNEWTASLIRSFDEIAGRVQLYMPSMLGAIGLLILGWVVGRLLRNWSVRLMTRVERRLEGHALRSASSRLGVERSASEVIGSFVFWAVFIIFLGAATDTLGLPVLATWLSGLSRFLPRLLLSALIVLAGVLAGTLVRDAISATRITLGRGAQFAIITAAVITGVDQIGIDSRSGSVRAPRSATLSPCTTCGRPTRLRHDAILRLAGDSVTKPLATASVSTLMSLSELCWTGYAGLIAALVAFLSGQHSRGTHDV